MAYTSINSPSDYFNTKLYTGTGSSNAITGVGFQPDWIWFKVRSEAGNHNLFDSIRGSNKILQSSTNIAEATSTALLTSFDSDGFTVNTDDGVNGSSKTYASWNWLASNTTASNTDGSITSTVSANTTSGFSIVSYTGTGANATVGHGLGVEPKMIIFKNRDSAVNWPVYHHSVITASATNKSFLKLNDTSALTTNTTATTVTSVSSSTFGIGTGDVKFNTNTNNYIAYCFAEKKGFSKFGSYTGNGSTDGTFVYTGFKPAWVMTKESATTGSWNIFDNRRENPFNVVKGTLKAEASNAEESNTNLQMDFVSNGFKLRGTGGDLNGSGTAMIYMAFAESPFTTSTGVPTTAR